MDLIYSVNTKLFNAKIAILYTTIMLMMNYSMNFILKAYILVKVHMVLEGNNSGDINRYNTYLEILKKYLSFSSVLCDVGCGKGGFIQFLQEKDYQNSLGLELDQRLINLSTSKKFLKQNYIIIL